MKNSLKKQQAKKITAQALFAFFSIALVPVYTLIFGTKEDPFLYTLSGIGNAFDHKLSFIFWGSITGLALVFYTLYVFAKIDYRDKRSRRFLYGSHLCLILTVLTPALKDVFPVWHFVHVVFSTLFSLLLVASILLFLQYLSKSNQELSKKSLFLLIGCVGMSVATLFLMGLNGVVEIMFFIGISVFLFVLGIYLDNFVEKKLKFKYKDGKVKGLKLELRDEEITFDE